MVGSSKVHLFHINWISLCAFNRRKCELFRLHKWGHEYPWMGHATSGCSSLLKQHFGHLGRCIFEHFTNGEPMPMHLSGQLRAQVWGVFAMVTARPSKWKRLDGKQCSTKLLTERVLKLSFFGKQEVFEFFENFDGMFPSVRSQGIWCKSKLNPNTATKHVLSKWLLITSLDPSFY